MKDGSPSLPGTQSLGVLARLPAGYGVILAFGKKVSLIIAWK
jgi:hypothetical protein